MDHLEPLVVEDGALGDEITQLIELDRAWMSWMTLQNSVFSDIPSSINAF